MGKLEPYFTHENARECGRNGGIKSGIVRRRKKQIREVCDALMAGNETRHDTVERLRGIASVSKKGSVRRDEALIASLYLTATADPTGDAKMVTAATNAANVILGLLTGMDDAITAMERQAAVMDENTGGVVVVPEIDDTLIDEDGHVVTGDGAGRDHDGGDGAAR